MYIRKFKIANFRSLKEVTIPNLNPITILHGDNDAGKSNVLAALEAIFKNKQSIVTVSTNEGQKPEKRFIGFWRGDIPEFTDNYYRNTDEPIKFEITIRFEGQELTEIINNKYVSDILCHKGGKGDDAIITGKIEKIKFRDAYQKLDKVTINNKSVYEEGEEGNQIYLQAVDKISEHDKYVIFENVLRELNDYFVIVPSRRYIKSEKDLKGEICSLDPNSFKNWLFNLEMDRGSYAIFENIKRVFADTPFNFGEIGFAREHDSMDILIKRGELRLPIERLGTGVQQILFLIANIIQSQARVVGIEELEINLSEKSQNKMLHILSEFIQNKGTRVRQIIITSHSYDYGEKGQVLRWWVENDGTETKIRKWDNDSEAALMETRIAKLMMRLSNEDLKRILLQEMSKPEIKSMLVQIFTIEEIKNILK